MCGRAMMSEDRLVCKTCQQRRRNLRAALNWANEVFDALAGIELYTLEPEKPEKKKRDAPVIDK